MVVPSTCGHWVFLLLFFLVCFTLDQESAPSVIPGGYPPFHDDNQAELFRRIKEASYKFDPQLRPALFLHT